MSELKNSSTEIKGKIKKKRVNPKFSRLRRAKGSRQQFNSVF